MEDFVEPHLCKLRGMLRSRGAHNGFFMWPHQGCWSLWRGTKSDGCGTQWVYEYVAVDMYVTLLVDVICMGGNKWSYITRWIGQTIPRYYMMMKDTSFNLSVRSKKSSKLKMRRINGLRSVNNLFERSEFLIATCKKNKTDRLCGCVCDCSANLGFSVRSANRIRPKHGIPLPV